MADRGRAFVRAGPRTSRPPMINSAGGTRKASDRRAHRCHRRSPRRPVRRRRRRHRDRRRGRRRCTSTPQTSWPWPSKACRHHAGAARPSSRLRGATTRGAAPRRLLRGGRTRLCFHSANNANSSPTSHRGPSAGTLQRGGSGDRAVVAAGGLEPGRDHHHAQPPAACGQNRGGSSSRRHDPSHSVGAAARTSGRTDPARTGLR